MCKIDLTEFERQMTEAFLTAVLFTESDYDDSDESPDDTSWLSQGETVSSFTDAAQEAAARVVVAFLTCLPVWMVREYLDAWPTREDAAERMGHDLWFTSQGHGTGFWDRNEIRDDLGKRLTDASKNFEHTLWPYRDDVTGRLHFA